MSKAQLARLIDLPDEALQQVLDYAATLSKADAADHFANLLGDAPAAVEFVAAFNGRRHDPAAGSSSSIAAGGNSSSNSNAIEPVPKSHRAKKKKAPLHTPPPRQVTSLAPPPGAAYNKKGAEDDYYISGRSGSSTPLLTGAGGGIQRGATPVSASSTPPPAKAAAMTPPPAQPSPQKQQQQQRSSAGGSLIQDALAPKPKAKSSASGGNSNSGGVAKIAITGGTAMHGASTALADFDAAIRSLEVSTNPTLSGGGGGGGGGGGKDDDVAARRCNCVATRHPLQTAAPNCLQCGKVVCVKEGLGPCTSCGAPLLSGAEVQAMIRELRAERGREKMAADREAHRRADTAGTGKNKMGAAVAYAHPRMIAGSTKWGGDDDGFVSLADSARAKAAEAQSAEAKARAHRDKLLAYQAENAQRTTVRDEAADFDVGDAVAAGAGGGHGSNLWATPEERARELRRQQKILREMEWNARPEYEKRQQVLSIDVTGRKVFRKVVAVERPPTPKSEDDEDDEYGGGGAPVLGEADANAGRGGAAAGGAFSKNPLLGRLIKPVYDAQSRAKAAAEEEAKSKDKGKGKKGKGKAGEGQEESGGSGSGSDSAPLPGRRDDPNAASRWRRVQDDLDNNEAVILDGGLYGRAAPTTKVTSDEPACG